MEAKISPRQKSIESQKLIAQCCLPSVSKKKDFFKKGWRDNKRFLALFFGDWRTGQLDKRCFVITPCILESEQKGALLGHIARLRIPFCFNFQSWLVSATSLKEKMQTQPVSFVKTHTIRENFAESLRRPQVE